MRITTSPGVEVKVPVNGNKDGASRYASILRDVDSIVRFLGETGRRTPELDVDVAKLLPHVVPIGLDWKARLRSDSDADPAVAQAAQPCQRTAAAAVTSTDTRSTADIMELLKRPSATKRPPYREADSIGRYISEVLAAATEVLRPAGAAEA